MDLTNPIRFTTDFVTTSVGLIAIVFTVIDQGNFLMANDDLKDICFKKCIKCDFKAPLTR